MRPTSILAFEWLWFGSLAVALVKVAAAWEESVDEIPVHFAVAVLVVSLAVTVTLVLLVSRRRSRVAKWAMIVLFVLGLINYLPLLRTGVDSFWVLIEILLAIVQAVGLGCLFTPSARTWFDGAEGGAPAIDALEQTFE